VLLTAEAGVSALLLLKSEILLDVSMDRKSTSPGGARIKKPEV